jgi:DNA-binding transcriptional LysR family regulator
MDYLEAMTAFVRAVELGSFSKAAAEAGLKVSTVSRYVSGLEADLGAALLNRSTRRLNPTEAGRLFYERASQILAEVEAARNATRSLNARPQGLLRINIPTGFGRRHIMPHMQAYLDEYPDIRLDATLTDATVDLIETATDVAIRIGALIDSSLIAKKLAPLHRVLVASRDYLDRAPKLAAPADLRGHQCLALAVQPTEAWYYRERKDPSHTVSAIDVHGRLRTNDAEAVRDAVLAGLGIALLPTWLVGVDVGANKLISLLDDYEWMISPGAEPAIWGVYPPKKVVSPKVRTFLSFLEQRFGRPAYWELTSESR